MSFSEALKYASEVERGWNRRLYESDVENAEYEEQCDYRYNQLRKELKSRKAELTEEDFTEAEYKMLEDYLRDYTLTPDTELQEVIDSFIDEIDN
ncbi:hypothetical protein [Leptotrichia trevisanii]|uniref:hypothetical protein n=1 Tax=Leptotrichia trevisanii TaxID=109328 RepID=UPI0003FC2695|nr:hypothetical protein [Leptotrichia trevisanii]